MYSIYCKVISYITSKSLNVLRVISMSLTNLFIEYEGLFQNYTLIKKSECVCK